MRNLIINSFSAVLLVLVFSGIANSQALYNNSSIISAHNGGIVSVNGDMENNGQININENAGTYSEMVVSDDFINDGTVGGSGYYKISGDWLNNSTFISSGTVYIEGAGNQLIGGTASTSFYNLVLSGAGVKSLGLDQYIINSLDLSSLELNTSTNGLYVQNATTGAISYSTGFVSSDNGGFLSRTTNSTGTYVFPVGSNSGTSRFRPVEITPSSTTATQYTVRFANLDATGEGYDVSSYSSAINNINNLFYHQISRPFGTASADISISYDNANDGSWDGIANWSTGAGEWQEISGSTTSSGAPYYTATISGWNSFTEEAYALLDWDVFSWTGNIDTDWATSGNWSTGSIPTAIDDISIPAAPVNQPIVSSSTGADCNDISIESGATLTIQSGGSFINNGTITNNGDMIAQLFITGGSLTASDYTWHSIGIPIPTATAGDYYLNDYMYSYVEAGNTWSNITPPPTVINQGEGYIIKTIYGDKTINFTGTLNSGTFNYPVTNTGGTVTNGYNFVANPYPAYLDLEEISGTNLGNTVWVWDPVAENYITYQTGTGAGMLGEYLHPMQAFFVKVNSGSTTGTVTLENADRVHNSASFYKNGNFGPERLVINAIGNGFEDHLFINKIDQVNDGYNFNSMNADVPQLYVQDQNDDFCIYNIPVVPSNNCIPLGFICDKDGNYNLKIEENDFDANYDVILEDVLEGTFTPISEGDIVSFDHDNVNQANRFCLHFNDVSDIEESTINDYIVRGDRNNIYVNTYDDYSEIEILDVNGRFIKEVKSEGEMDIPIFAAGMYIVKIKSESNTQISKVVVTK